MLWSALIHSPYSIRKHLSVSGCPDCSLRAYTLHYIPSGKPENRKTGISGKPELMEVLDNVIASLSTRGCSGRGEHRGCKALCGPLQHPDDRLLRSPAGRAAKQPNPRRDVRVMDVAVVIGARHTFSQHIGYFYPKPSIGRQVESPFQNVRLISPI